jgi:hypothetical protein
MLSLLTRCKQARVVAYKQYLESYFTVSLPSMAATFGVSDPSS